MALISGLIALLLTNSILASAPINSSTNWCLLFTEFENQSKCYVANVFTQMIPLLKSELINQHLWIIEENRIRIRGKN